MKNNYHWTDILENVSAVALYGAGVVAYNVSQALLEVYGISTTNFFVSSDQDTNGFGGIKAERISVEMICAEGNPTLLIATPEEYQEAIVNHLEKMRISHYICLNSELVYDLMRRYFHKKGFLMVEELNHNKVNFAGNELAVYMAKSIYDRAIKTDSKLPEWIYAVQAGKKLTDRRIASITDDSGINISERNKDYCELTVSYWAWKNKTALYKGICHYRRLLVLSIEDISAIIDNDVDVVLPLPYLCKQNASDQFLRYISIEDMKVFQDILLKCNPGQAKEILETFQLNYIYNHNILIAKQTVYDDYCSFMFPILFEVEHYYRSRGIIRQDRYLGYLGELLTSAYFIMNADHLKIVHTEERWMA